MYARYHTQLPATQNQIREDIVALMCGTTDISTLSASCNQTESSIIVNTVSAGWELWDAAASATSSVVRALNADGVTYKYLQISYATTVLSFLGWESWNATTHVGTNATAAISSQNVIGTHSITFNSGTAYDIFIKATPRGVTISQGPVWGTASMTMAEISRDTRTLGPDYPVHCCFSSANAAWLSSFSTVSNPAIGGVSISRVKNPAAAGDMVGTGITGFIMNMVRFTSVTGGAWGTPVQAVPTTLQGYDGVTYVTALPIILGMTLPNSGNGAWCVLGRLLGGILYIPATAPTFTQLDEVVFGTDTYFLTQHGGTPIAHLKE